MSLLFRSLSHSQSTGRRVVWSARNICCFPNHCYYSVASTRLFTTSNADSSNSNTPEETAGEIYIEDDQTDLKVDLERIRDTMTRIRKILQYESYGVSLLLVDDQTMQETNRETRNVNAPTDILSFPMLNAITPGVLDKPEFDLPDFYNLGDMMVDVAYVMRRCQEDQAEYENGARDAGNSDEEEDERGVSGAMATIFDPETRVNMLLVHGMLHLVGHDHEEDDEYEVMVKEEERIMKLLGMV